MPKVPTLIQFDRITHETMPHYYDFAISLQAIKDALIKETHTSYQMYRAEDNMEEIWDIVNQMVQHQSEKVKIMAHVFDCMEIATIGYTSFNNENQFIVKPSINNNVFLFQDFNVALAKLPIYQNHEDYEEDFIFAKDDQSLLEFSQYIYEKQKKYMQGFINIFVDTDEGIERVKERITNQVKREDVLLDEEMKTEIFRSFDEFFLHSGEFFKKYQIPYKRGILLYGAPGNGKTTLVKSIAGSVDAPVVYWQITEYTTSYSIKEVFSTVTKMAPMILVIEDIDSMPEETRSVFLNTLDGAASKEGIFLIGTTNYPEKIDPALINRAGRFDRAYEINLPNYEARKQYLQARKMEQFMSEEEIEQLAQETDGLSIAQLNELYMSISLQWHYDKKVKVDKIIQELQTNNKKTWRQDWETDPRQSMGFGF